MRAVFLVQLPVGSLHAGQGANSSPGAAAGGVPGLRGAAGHADSLGSRVHRRPVRHAAGRPAGASGDTQTICEQDLEKVAFSCVSGKEPVFVMKQEIFLTGYRSGNELGGVSHWRPHY